MTPEIYHRVTEARPELAVLNLAYDHAYEDWEHTDYPCWLSEFHAHALILAHWENMLPDGYYIGTCPHTKRTVIHRFVEGKCEFVVSGESRLLALAEFHVPSSTKGAKP